MRTGIVLYCIVLYCIVLYCIIDRVMDLRLQSEAVIFCEGSRESHKSRMHHNMAMHARL